MCCTAINGIKCTNKNNSVGFTILLAFRARQTVQMVAHMRLHCRRRLGHAKGRSQMKEGERGNEGKIKRKWTRDDEFGRYLLLSNVWWHESRGHRVVYFRVPLGLIWCVSLSSVYAYVSLCLRLANNCLLSLQLTVKAKIITPAAGEASFDGFSRLPDTAT